MAVRHNPLWDNFFSPVVRFLIDEQKWRRYALSIDWEKQSDRWRRGDVIIPSYYSSQNFQGIEGGYLNSELAVFYDPIIQYTLPPNETLVRQAVIDAVKVHPRRILDLGCGTGSTTLMLKQAFPHAEVIGVDLSPYMLVRAEDKARTANLEILWRHGNAENTTFKEATFDLVTAALLLHETPSVVSQAILRESFRLLVGGGQLLILDGNQQTLRQLEQFNDIFDEPYIREYVAGNLDASMYTAGFQAVRSQDVCWINQITSGIKPILATDVNTQKYTPRAIDSTIDNNDLEGLGSPVFGIIA